jgi:SAM-dependent methyltransferase
VDEYLARNRAIWTESNARFLDADAVSEWQRPEIVWGIWRIPEFEIGALPATLEGLDVVELGCGTAFFSAWLAQRGARPVGVDPTPAQLATARRCQRELGIDFPLVDAPGEAVPLPDTSFDLALSEYGASLWADPERWIPEAARLLRPGGRLVFLTNAVVSILCSPDEGGVQERLIRPQFGLFRVDWATGTEFHLSHGDMLRLLRRHGFDVVDLIELQPAADARTHPEYTYVPLEWARRWPCEEIWVAEKRA